MTSDSSLVLEGEAVRTIFENKENGYYVFKLKPHITSEQFSDLADSEGLVTVVGNASTVRAGQVVRAVGLIDRQRELGPQFRAQIITTSDPTTLTGIERYLGSGIVEGIGPAKAKSIVEKFGARTVQVLDHEPELLRGVHGLNEKLVNLIIERWKESRLQHEVLPFLTSLGLGAAISQRIYKKFAGETLNVVRESPYRLSSEVSGLGFKTADLIACRVGLPPGDPKRLQAGILSALQVFHEEDGHTVVARHLLQGGAASLLLGGKGQRMTPGVLSHINQAIDSLVTEGKLVESSDGLISPRIANEEQGLATSIFKLFSACVDTLMDVDRAIDRYESSVSVKLAPAQRKAVELAACSSFAVVTGGPGVGKTTVIRAILSLFEGEGLQTILIAPTGRAAKRMNEVTGHEAKTIHRLLAQNFDPISVRAVIIDETSMVDMNLAQKLFSEICPGTRVILVGDVDQLPSIGPGSVLRDVINSGAVPTVRLTEVFRQTGSSRIIEGAHDINLGKEPSFEPIENTEGELFFIERYDADAADEIVKLVCSHDNPLRDVQVLVPMNKGYVGTLALNASLQAALNPKSDFKSQVKRPDVIFRVGDRVMQIRNDYERGVFNGDVGLIVSIRSSGTANILNVIFDENKEVSYVEGDDLDDNLILAYACTVHKAQGSEYPIVVLGLIEQHYPMLMRKLLYTAVTRAKKRVFIVGSREALGKAVRDIRGTERCTTLARLLREESSRRTNSTLLT